MRSLKHHYESVSLNFIPRCLAHLTLFDPDSELGFLSQASSDGSWRWGHLKVPLCWKSKMTSSLTCLVPSLLTWLKRLGAVQASISMYPLHMTSVAFRIAWQSLGHQTSYVGNGFSRENTPKSPGTSCKASCALAPKPQDVSHYHCILLVKVTKTCSRFKGKGIRLWLLTQVTWI